MKPEDRELVEKAKNVIAKSYDGKYHVVGAALRGKSGRVYVGVNCDGIHGSCAEFTAMGAAVAAGEDELDTVVAVRCKEGDYFIVPPCGDCRQMLFEYCPEIRVIVEEDTALGIRQLLPYPYIE